MSNVPVQQGSPERIGRPRGLVALAGLETAFGALGVGGGGAVLMAAHLAPPQAPAFFLEAAPVIGALLIGFGGLAIVLGQGLWRGAAWAWGLVVAMELVHLVSDLGSFAIRGFAPDKLIGMAVILAVLYYLTRPAVRAYCGLRRAQR